MAPPAEIITLYPLQSVHPTTSRRRKSREKHRRGEEDQEVRVEGGGAPDFEGGVEDIVAK